MTALSKKLRSASSNKCRRTGKLLRGSMWHSDLPHRSSDFQFPQVDAERPFHLRFAATAQRSSALNERAFESMTVERFTCAQGELQLTLTNLTNLTDHLHQSAVSAVSLHPKAIISTGLLPSAPQRTTTSEELSGPATGVSNGVTAFPSHFLSKIDFGV